MDLSVLLMDIKYISAELTIIITIILVILADLFFSKRNKSILAYIGVGGVVLAAIIGWQSKGIQVTAFSGTLTIDVFGLFFKELLLVISGLTLFISMEYVRFREINLGEFYALILFASLGMMIMVSGADLLNIYLGLELNAIACCVLVGFFRNSAKSNEAALKYFILSLFSSGILLYGVSLIYGVTDEINIYRIAQYLSSHPETRSHPMLHMGLLLLVVGFGFKVAYVPFHMWVPDVYEGAPVTVAAFLSLGPKVAGLAALVRILMISVLSIKFEWAKLFWLLSVVTMTLGNVVALRQDNIKRLLAYSGIAHVGYMMIGLVAAAYSPEFGISSMAFYLLCYSFFNVGPFAIITLLCSKEKRADFVEDFNGLSIRSPISALMMSIFLFSLAGIPPTGGFVAKFFIFAAAMKAKLYWLVIIGIMNSAIATFYYLRVVIAMYVREPEKDLVVNPSPGLSFALLIMVGFTLLTGICPSWFIDFARYSIKVVI
jgi:NADH-quinone oxidoreductase subunit N